MYMFLCFAVTRHASTTDKDPRTRGLPRFSSAPYAILSHRWGQQEVTYKEMRRFQKDNLNASKEERYHVAQLSGPGMAKIKNFCQKASENGFDWGWIDTCCIDKRSSAELSEV